MEPAICNVCDIETDKHRFAARQRRVPITALLRPLANEWKMGRIAQLACKGAVFMDSAIASVFHLSPPEKLQLVQDLWDDLASAPGNVPVHDWQIAELDRRRQKLLSEPGSAIPWEEFDRRLRERYGS